MTLFVEEFLYRGKPPGSVELPAWHVVLGDAVTDAFGNQAISLSGPLTPARAETLGYSLAAVIADLNAGIAASADALRVELAAVKAERDALTEQLRAATAPSEG